VRSEPSRDRAPDGRASRDEKDLAEVGYPCVAGLEVEAQANRHIERDEVAQAYQEQDRIAEDGNANRHPGSPPQTKQPSEVYRNDAAGHYEECNYHENEGYGLLVDCHPRTQGQGPQRSDDDLAASDDQASQDGAIDAGQSSQDACSEDF